MNNNGAQGSEESSGPSSGVKTTVFKSLSGGSKNSYKGRPVSSAGSALSFEGRRYVTGTGGACSTSSRTASKENVNNGGLILVTTTTTTSSVNNKVSWQSLWCAGSTAEHDHHHFCDQCDGIAGGRIVGICLDNWGGY